jgi:hypothetical protein
MKPRSLSARRRLPATQMALPLEAVRIAALDSSGRATVIAVLASLLRQAVAPPQGRESINDAP